MDWKVIIGAETTKSLCEMFDQTEKEPETESVFMVRGWIMDELKSRNAKAFDKWIEFDGSPTKYFVK